MLCTPPWMCLCPRARRAPTAPRLLGSEHCPHDDDDSRPPGSGVLPGGRARGDVSRYREIVPSSTVEAGTGAPHAVS
jgi:hypothetical protein